jgi:hypothetical protein
MSRFSMHAGDTPQLVGRVLQTPAGPPFDLTGYSVTMYGPDFTLVGAAAGDPTAGNYLVNVPKSATQAYRVGPYPFRIVITAGALQYTVVSDRFQILT